MKKLLSFLFLCVLCIGSAWGKDTWTLVADASTLKAGDKLVIASNAKGASAGDISSSIMSSVESTFSSDGKTITSLGPGTVQLTLGGTSGAWTLANAEGKLLGATAVKKVAWGSGTTTWSISISNGDATIQNGTSTYGRFLYNVGSPRFIPYTSDTSATMLLPQLYRLEGGTTETVNVTGVSLDKTELNLETNGEATLTATVAPANATNKNVTWSSDNNSVATVDQTGKVTAVAAGTATITATTEDGEFTATCAVSVSTVGVTGVTLDKESFELGVGSTQTLIATVEPANATNKSVTWISSDESVATVDQTGKVTAVAAGEATITVKTTDGEFTATCTVTVFVPTSYSIDFENEVSTYSDWTFINMTSQQTGTITAHGGTSYGTTGGTSTAAIQTKNKILLPTNLTCYVSKQTNNTTSSTWYIQTSSDGTTWNEVETQSATSMNTGTWVGISADLSSCKNVYVRIYYSGSTAIRNIDDVSLTFDTPRQCTITWSVNGDTQVIQPTTADEATLIELPTVPATNVPEGYSFMGWTEEEYKDAPNAQHCITESYMLQNLSSTLYAVFAKKTDIEPYWEKVVDLSTVTNGIYALLTTDGHAFNGTIKEGHGQVTSTAYSFTDGKSTSIPEGVCELTFIANGGGYLMYNKNNGYLYAIDAKSGSLAWNSTTTTTDCWKWSAKESNWVYNANTAYLQSYNNGSIRTYGVNNGDVLIMAKKIDSSYSDYCTTITAPQTQEVNISAAGYATAYIPFAATISNEANDVKAYYVTLEELNEDENKAYLKPILGTIPANTGIVLKGSQGAVTFSESTEQPVDVTGNLLIGTTDDGGDVFCEEGYTYYILSVGKNTGKVGFYYDPESNEGDAAICAQYKAVLQVPTEIAQNVKGFSFAEFNDDVDAINSINADKKQLDGAIYNLNGQRLNGLQKGMNIVNGKKLFVK